MSSPTTATSSTPATASRHGGSPLTRPVPSHARARTSTGGARGARGGQPRARAEARRRIVPVPEHARQQRRGREHLAAIDSKPGGKYGELRAAGARPRSELTAPALSRRRRRAHGGPHAAPRSRCWKRSTASRLGRRRARRRLAAMAAERASPPPMSLHGIRLTRTPARRAGACAHAPAGGGAQRLRCVGPRSLTPAINTTSTRRRRGGGNEQRRDEAVAERLGRVLRRRHERAPHGASVACNDHAIAGGGDASAGVVEQQTRARDRARPSRRHARAPKPKRRASASARVARRTARVVRGPPMPMKTRFASGGSAARARARAAAPARKSRRPRGVGVAHATGGAERAAHRAADLRRHAQRRARACVRRTAPKCVAVVVR